MDCRWSKKYDFHSSEKSIRIDYRSRVGVLQNLANRDTRRHLIGRVVTVLEMASNIYSSAKDTETVLSLAEDPQCSIVLVLVLGVYLAMVILSVSLKPIPADTLVLGFQTVELVTLIKIAT